MLGTSVTYEAFIFKEIVSLHAVRRVDAYFVLKTIPFPAGPIVNLRYSPSCPHGILPSSPTDSVRR
jgi:hypothetical protein